jgi:hypothetical protein
LSHNVDFDAALIAIAQRQKHKNTRHEP